MKVLFLGFLALFSFSSFACPVVDVLKINGLVYREVLENLEIDKRNLVGMKLIQTENYYNDPTDTCPSSVIFYHSFKAEKPSKKCAILTKYKVSFDREEINDFSVLDFECR